MPNMRQPIMSCLAGFTMLFGLLSTVTPAFAASAEKVVYSFKNNHSDGTNPFAGLTFDAAGNLFGTTCCGGTHGYGTVFQLSLRANGKWAEKILHNFESGDKDGANPDAGLTFDAAGRLYGTTENGGRFDNGIVFELTPGGDGKWTRTVLHNFQPSKGGANPRAGVIIDAVGNLYGTTEHGGNSPELGTVFQLTRGGKGKWTERVLHAFRNYGKDGKYPFSGLIFDSAGNLYGTTAEGGAYNNGTVFQLIPGPVGKWTEKILYSFSGGSDGANPLGILIFDATGNLYGTTGGGGAYNYGTAFELLPAGNGGWVETVLHSFNGADGENPYDGLVFDAAGNLYGTTSAGGASGLGTVFELIPGLDGTWTEMVLHDFDGTAGDYTWAGVVIDQAGNLYGTTQEGGDGSCSYGCGTVFEITP